MSLPQTVAPAVSPTRPLATPARFVTGPIMGHVISMTMMASIGLMAVFLVDFADLYFVALLGETEITAAAGFAGTIAFTNLSIALAIGIASSALIARNLGARRPEEARAMATTGISYAFIAGLVLAIGLAVFAETLLELMGARGKTLDHATTYFRILVFGFPFMTMGINCSFSLRAIGDPRRAMYVTLTTAATNAVLDPLLIFGLGMGMNGAAVATVCANMLAFGIGLHSLTRVHRFLDPPQPRRLIKDLRPVSNIALPATATQLAMPFSLAYLTWAAADYGDDAVAAVTIINRLVPFAFGFIFALSGAIGPIVGQNYGAQQYQRVKRTISDGLMFNGIYTLGVVIILFILAEDIPQWFRSSPETAELVVFYCQWLIIAWGFAGAQFVCQAAFNNLGKAIWSAMFNWGKATIGTIPFVIAGAHLAGPKGILIGAVIGSVIFGLVATLAAYRLVGELARDESLADPLGLSK